MVDYREILRLKSLNYSNVDIASSVHSSRNTIHEVLKLAELLMLWSSVFVTSMAKKIIDSCLES